MSFESDLTEITQMLQAGGVAVVRTDTIYGIIALAANEQAVQKVYDTKHRDPLKQCIVLVAEAPEHSEFGELVEQYSANALTPTSVVVPATNEPEWLLRGGSTIAYRVVRDEFLKKVVEMVGPVIAPSANPEGLEPARTVEQARAYFGDTVDCYIDGGEVPEEVQPSEIIQISGDREVEIIRGALAGSVHRSSGGLIFKDGKVLLIHWEPPRDSYDFPKGTIEPSETSEEACVREVFEETGYKTRIVSFVGSNEFNYQTQTGEWRHKINDYYLLELTDEPAIEAQREPHETFENVWVPIEDAAGIITRKINVAIFEKAVALNSQH